jgi:hypothetical protein
LSRWRSFNGPCLQSSHLSRKPCVDNLNAWINRHTTRLLDSSMRLRPIDIQSLPCNLVRNPLIALRLSIHFPSFVSTAPMLHPTGDPNTSSATVRGVPTTPDLLLSTLRPLLALPIIIGIRLIDLAGVFAPPGTTSSSAAADLRRVTIRPGVTTARRFVPLEGDSSSALRVNPGVFASGEVNSRCGLMVAVGGSNSVSSRVRGFAGDEGSVFA